ncbi:MAG: metalloregulator ArsR/SmtB family transcription factor [Bacteroidetes bacterium]|nr:metalloregulator ArsR/SmtB family transcription factor [Bacteroidota bacterium]
MDNQSIKCIRVLADVNQIKNCKDDLVRIEHQTKSLASVLGLSGNQVRLKILFLLFKESQMCPCDLSDVLEMTVPAVSQHLRKLKDGGLVTDKKVGQTIFYSVIPENARILTPVLNELIELNHKETVK